MSLTKEALQRALDIGLKLDLSHCVYGPAHWQGEGVWTPIRYYHFLAGLVRTTDARRVAELGTHYGGSICAMQAGLKQSALEPPVLVTCDITRLNEDGIARYSEIHRVQGDSLSPEVVEEFCRYFDDHVDILYVDTAHTYAQTMENIAVYANRLKPKLLVLDDIRLNHDTRVLWLDLSSAGAGECIDLSELVDREDAGFGLIDCRYPYHWRESSPMVRTLKRAAWSGRRALSSRLPEKTKDRLRAVRDRLRWG